MVFVVTGGCGFIGLNFVKHLVTQCPEQRVVVVDKLIYCSCSRPQDEVPEAQFVRMDICDTERLSKLFDDIGKIDTVFHFAAQTHVDESYKSSVKFSRDNCLGTHSLLEALRGRSITKLVHISTDEVYGEVDEGDSSTETSAFVPTNPYAATKVGAEFIVQSYYRSFQIPCSIVRMNNVYGPGQFPDKLIPKFMRNLLEGKLCPIQGSGTARRNFLYVGDSCRAIWSVAQEGATDCTVYNVGCNDEYSVYDIATKLVEMVCPGTETEQWVTHVADRVYNDKRYHVDCSRLKALGWKPEMPFDEGLNITLDWYKDHAQFWLGTTRRLLMWGARGFVGKQLKDAVLDASTDNDDGVEIIEASSRADDAEGVAAELDSLNPHGVIVCVGRIRTESFNSTGCLESCEMLPTNLQDNLLAPVTVCQLANDRKIHVSYVGTGCIFDTPDNLVNLRPYTETDPPNFSGSAYSAVKNVADRIINRFPNVLTFRIRMPISSEKHRGDFLRKISQYDNIRSVPNSVTVLDNLAPLMAELILAEKKGIYHVVNRGTIDHKTMLEIRDPGDAKQKNYITASELESLNKDSRGSGKTCNCFLESSKLEREFPGRVLNSKQAVAAVCAKLQTSV